MRGSERQSRLGNSASARLADGECNSKIRDHRLPGLKKNVLGLEITMNHAVCMCVLESVRNRDSDSNCLIHRQLLLTGETGSKRLTVDERHYIV